MNKCEVRRALDELLSYCEGYDPKEQLPDEHVPVRIVWQFEGRECQTIAWYTEDHGVKIWLPCNDTGNYVPVELVTRWYPLPGGGR